MKQFRFQTLEIWEDAMTIAESLLDISDESERQKYFRFADQMRGAAMSMSNNIAEGSGSASKKVFARYLDIARGSVFENANIIILLHHRKYITDDSMNKTLDQLEVLSRRITTFKKSLFN